MADTSSIPPTLLPSTCYLNAKQIEMCVSRRSPPKLWFITEIAGTVNRTFRVLGEPVPTATLVRSTSKQNSSTSSISLSKINGVAALAEAWLYPQKRSKMINFAPQVSDGRPRRGFRLNTVRPVRALAQTERTVLSQKSLRGRPSLTCRAEFIIFDLFGG